MQLAPDGEPGNYIQPQQQNPNQQPPGGTPPYDPFKQRPPQPNPNPPPPEPEAKLNTKDPKLVATATGVESDTAALRLAPRISPQPASITLGPGETKLWNIVGMDLDDLSVPELTFHFNPRAMDVTDVAFGPALAIDPAAIPAIAIDREAGTIKVKPTNGKPLEFVSGGIVLAIRVHGGLTGETFLVIENPDLRNESGQQVVAAITGGRARVE
jgi:hypothetical protein